MGAQVFFRYILRSPIYWVEELARLLFVYIVLIGSIICFEKDTHIKVNLPWVTKNIASNKFISLIKVNDTIIFLFLLIFFGKEYY